MLGSLIKKADLSLAIVVLLAATTTVAYNLSSAKIQSNDVGEDPTTKLLIRGVSEKLLKIHANFSSKNSEICTNAIWMQYATALEEELQQLQKELDDHRKLAGDYNQYGNISGHINYYKSAVNSFKENIRLKEHGEHPCVTLPELPDVFSDDKNLLLSLNAFVNRTHISPYDEMTMITCLETKINQSTFDQNTLLHMVYTRGNIENGLINKTAELFKTAMIFDVYANNDQIVKLADALFQFKPSVSSEVMHRAIDGVYGKISKRKIADNMWSNPHIPQIADGLVYTYEKMKSTDSSATLKVAQYLSHLLKRANYSSEMTEHGVDQVNFAIQSMPRSVINLYFSENRCLKSYNHIKSNTDNGFRWYIENELGSDVFYVRNHANSIEYLYASKTEVSEEYHYVITSFITGLKTYYSTWNVEIHGEKLLIRNIANNEYLCDISEQRPDATQHTYGLRIGGIARSNCEWKLQSCN